MEQVVLFEQKVALSPRDMNRMGTTKLDDILLDHLRERLEGRCSSHGFVLKGSLELLSRSMGVLEHGRYTGNVIYHVQAQGKVFNPANGTRVRGTILKKNKMGLYMIYEDAIRILVPRDLHLGSDSFEALEPGTEIDVVIRKSRFQINDDFILSIAVLSDSEGNAIVPVETNTEATEQVVV
jgi:DNA-directed RNA polymerase subunit E'/Rpb7